MINISIQSCVAALVSILTFQGERAIGQHMDV